MEMEMEMEKEEIPELLAMEIVSKLPAKSLARFRCVCRGWSSCFQTSHFITKHYRNNLDNHNLNVLVRGYDDQSIYFSALSTQDEDEDEDEEFVVRENIKLPAGYNPSIQGPCNGLFCIVFQNIFLAL